MQPYEAPQFGNRAPGGTRCAQHAHERALTTCYRCGDYCCDACYDVGRDGMDYCLRCGQAVSAPLAGAGTRFVAQMINLAAVGGLVLGAGLLTVVGEEAPGRGGPLFWLGMAGAFLGGLAWISVNIYYLSKGGQSVGKKIVGIRIVRTNGQPADLGRLLLLRWFLPSLIGQFCGLFSLVDALMVFAHDRRCIHDHFADTIVVNDIGPSTF